MDGLSFVSATPPLGSDLARADIACFVGFVPRRAKSRLPESLRAWLEERGWRPNRDGRTADDLADLRDVPVPIANWEAFDWLFAWDDREVKRSFPDRCDTLLGAAVRSFFAQGGRNCYVVRLGDPWPVFPGENNNGPAPAEDGSSFLPRFSEPSAVDRTSWKGIGHLFGLPDVSFLCLPDLVELFAVKPLKVEPETITVPPEEFKECAEEPAPSPPPRPLVEIPAPRFDEKGFQNWTALVVRIGDFLYRKAREVQLVAAIPLPVDVHAAAGQPGSRQLVRAAAEAQWKETAAIKTAFVQLVYPWLRTRNSGALPGRVEPPDGVVAGLLANSALAEGSWRNVIRRPVPGISAVEPVLDAATLAGEFSAPDGPIRTVRERVTLIGPAPDGFRMLSDVTMDADEAYRSANINRLACAIVRAARVAGESSVFRNNGPELWLRLRERLHDLLAGLWAQGALGGESAAEAFEVRCDRSTMTQADLDSGRAICVVSFTAAAPIVHITIVLAMEEGGGISIAARETAAAPQSQAA
jgi:hypothetical protein